MRRNRWIPPRRSGAARSSAYRPNVELEALRQENVRATDKIITALNERRILLAFEPVVTTSGRRRPSMNASCAFAAPTAASCRPPPWCRKRADHDSFAEPTTARTYGARSCGMRVLPLADGSTGSAGPEPVEELAGRMRATGAGARSLCAQVAVPVRCSVRRGAAMTEHAVVIAGGGPTGLMLAGELALAGIDVVIVERRASQDLDGSRAGGLHSRTIEVLDQRGIADRFLAEGQAMQVQGFAGIPLDISDFPTRHNYGLALWQSRLRAHPGRLGQRAGGADPSRTRGDGLRAGRHRRRRRTVRRPRRSGRSTWSGATEDAA